MEFYGNEGINGIEDYEDSIKLALRIHMSNNVCAHFINGIVKKLPINGDYRKYLMSPSRVNRLKTKFGEKAVEESKGDRHCFKK